MSIHKIIETFDPITLAQMDEVSLMSRVDTKFVFNLDVFMAVLPQLKQHYFLLDINGVRLNAYRSLYFDTDDFQFFQAHHNGKKNRSKVRFREYIDSGLCFLEVKRKNNKGVTNKVRKKVPRIEEQLKDDNLAYVQALIGNNDLNSKHWNMFSRITLVNKKIKERLTFDINFRFEKEEQKGSFENIVIAEVKQEKVNYASPFMRLIKTNGIRPFRISKYCLATASLYPELKQNNFKSKFLHINQL